MKKGKSRMGARTDIMRSRAANARRRARLQQSGAKSYDRRAYDKPAGGEQV